VDQAGTTSTESPGVRVQAAVSQVLRWASRSDVRRELWGAAGRTLSPTDMWLMDAIVANGPIRATDLAEWQGVDKSTITPQVRRLEERGLVARRPDPVDRRAALLTATPRGRQLRRTLSANSAALFDEVLQDWPQADRQTLGVLLERLARSLTDDTPAPPG
jgi:DNA-binding MarR family transcriptional regulator